MNCRKRIASNAFSLIEIMIAVLFISIAFFGYVALHSRILHSGQRLEEKEEIRAATDFFEAIEVARVKLGVPQSITAEPFPADPGISKFYRLDTALAGRSLDWTLAYPPEYHTALEETMELHPRMLAKPYHYSWEKR